MLLFTFLNLPNTQAFATLRKPKIYQKSKPFKNQALYEQALFNSDIMKIVIAPNSFKGSLNSFQVAQAIKKGLVKSNIKADYSLFPIADGGDHTLEVFQSWLGGVINKSKVFGPFGDLVDAKWAMVDNGKTAVIEMAKASGIGLVNEDMLDPMKANTYGTGQLIKLAVKSGAKKIILGLGGSATVDGGLGILQALGAELFDAKGNILDKIENPLLKIADISIDKIDSQLREIEFQILCDVQNPLLGKQGTSYVFAPQKGANSRDVEILEKSMERFNSILIQKIAHDYSTMEGAGAAGGIAVGLKSFFDVSLVSGVDFLLEKMGFEEELKDADLLITAEGKVDRQTLQGKGPAGVAAKASAQGVPSIILAGKAEDIDHLLVEFDAVFSITNGPISLEKAMNSTAKDLENTARQIGNLLYFSLL